MIELELIAVKIDPTELEIALLNLTLVGAACFRPLATREPMSYK
jgi:hypothetical protein